MYVYVWACVCVCVSLAELPHIFYMRALWNWECMHYFLLERPANLCATRMAAPPSVSPLSPLPLSLPLQLPPLPPLGRVWYVSLCPSRACLQLMPSLTAAWQSLCECHMNFSRLTVACGVCVCQWVCVPVCVCVGEEGCAGGRTDVCCCWRTIFVHLEQLTQFVCALDLTIALPRPHSNNRPYPKPPLPPPLLLSGWQLGCH